MVCSFRYTKYIESDVLTVSVVQSSKIGRVGYEGTSLFQIIQEKLLFLVHVNLKNGLLSRPDVQWAHDKSCSSDKVRLF